MSNLQLSNSGFLKRRDFKLAPTIFKQSVGGSDEIELIISIASGRINVKELSCYLDFIYRIDGMLSPAGYASYVHNPNLQIEIDEIRLGSWELIIQSILNSFEADKLVIFWLTLKYLPNTLNNLLDIPIKTIDFLNKREEYLEKKDRRKLRKNIRELVKSEVDLTGLDDRKKKQLVNILDELYARNTRRLTPSIRFAKKFIKSIKLIPRKKN